MHQSFVSTPPPPHLRGWRWNSRVMVQDKYFLIVPAVPGKCGGVITLGHVCPAEIFCSVGGLRVGLLPSACTHRAELISAL